MDQLSLKQRLVDPLQAEHLQRDVTLVCDDKIPQQYHQCLLASYSPFLRNLLAERACCSCKSASCGGLTEVAIILDGFKREVMMNLMQYIYTGECKVKNRKMILDMIELKKCLGIDVEIDFSVNKSKPVVDDNVSDDASTRAGQKRVTLAIMSAIEQMNSGVSKVLCSECDKCLTKDSFMLHYRNHMQDYSQPQTANKKCQKCGAEVAVEEFSEHLVKHKKDTIGKDDMEVENFSEFLKNKFSTTNVKKELFDTDEKQSNVNEEGFDDDAENVMQSHGDQEPGINIDMQEYEKLLRSNIHTLIVGRKRKKAKMMKEPENGLVLVSQQEIDEEILKNPRNKEEEYGRLKVRNVYRKIYDRKQKLKSRDKTDKEPIVVTDEEIQDEIDKENDTRIVKINLDVRKIKSARPKGNFNSPQNITKVPSTPRRNISKVPNTPRSERKSISTSKLNIDESERKKIYHRLYVNKWNKNEAEGLSSPIHITDEEIMKEFSSKR